jgi:hypothetical protein
MGTVLIYGIWLNIEKLGIFTHAQNYTWLIVIGTQR